MLNRLRAIALLLAFTFPLVACSSAGEDTAQPLAPAIWEQAGTYPVGHTAFSLEDATRERTLSVHVFYPADSFPSSKPLRIEELLPEGEDRETFADLVAKAPDGCTRKEASSFASAPLAIGNEPWPLVVFSHCHGCLGISSFSIAERLASHGFIVAAPDHTGDTLFESQAGSSAPLDGEFLATRADDVSFVLDRLLDPGSLDVPEELRGQADPGRVGVFGHSFGGATTGLVLQNDSRVKAGFAIAAPMQSPLLPGPDMAKIDKPVAFLLAREDNSITEIGNAYIRANFQAATQRAWLFEVEDAGHWSFSDLCAVVDGFRPGCGPGKRQQGREPFVYLDNQRARDIGASYVTAFMAAELRDDPQGRSYLDTPEPGGM